MGALAPKGRDQPTADQRTQAPSTAGFDIAAKGRRPLVCTPLLSTRGVSPPSPSDVSPNSRRKTSWRRPRPVTHGASTALQGTPSVDV